MAKIFLNFLNPMKFKYLLFKLKLKISLQNLFFLEMCFLISLRM